MRIKRIFKIHPTIAATVGLLLTFTFDLAYAGTMAPMAVGTVGKIYFGVFGGGGSANEASLGQYGTSFYPEARGGPLAVNAFGHSNNQDLWFVGGHMGYRFPQLAYRGPVSSWGLIPAVELEGYNVGKTTFLGNDIVNVTTRLPEHSFSISYPLKTGVFLTNAVLNFVPDQCRWHPYVAAGIGTAFLSISNAISTQIAPVEPGINQFNSNPNATDTTFAAQGKVGLDYEISPHLSLFAEYRGLYLANSGFTFGSTVYPTHNVTTNWHLELGDKYYNLGAVGLHFTL